MRIVLFLSPLLLIATASPAQVVGTTGSLGSNTSGTTGSTTSTGNLSNIAPLGRLPRPLGAITSLGERIDRAAGLGTSRARGGVSLPASVRPEGRAGSGTSGGLLSGGDAIETAGRPAGTPFGTTPNGVGNAANTLPR